MKTSLDKLYKTDPAHEKEGIDIRITDSIVFRIRRYGGSNSQKVNQALAKYHKPFAAQIANNTLSEEVLTEIMAKVFAESCLISWEGIVDEETNEEIKCTFDNAVKLFKDLPELFNDLFRRSQNVDYFKVELGNF